MMEMPTIALALFAVQDTAPRRVESVAAVDLERYAGLWYEVARLPNSFQQKCRGESTASYQLLPDGELRVVNSCEGADGKPIRVEGRARLADPSGPNSRLEVRFAPKFLSFLSMVWGDYWILAIDDDYRAALVGTPDRKYLWVLSRTPELDQPIYERLVGIAADQGFAVSRLRSYPPRTPSAASPRQELSPLVVPDEG